MPTAAPLAIPAAMLPAGPLNPVDWIDMASPNGVAGAQQSALMRGTPGMAFWQRRQIAGPPTVAQGWPAFIHSRGFSRGAGAYSPKFGTLNINPIGAGVVTPYRIPTISGPGARYQFAAIWFDVQSVPTTIRMSPTMTQEGVDAILAQSTVAAMYPTTG